MSGILAVDFGTSNSLVASWDEINKEGIPLFLPDFSRFVSHAGNNVPIIPSLISYSEGGKKWIGDQVLQKGLYHNRRTFRWMKRYISLRSPIKINLGDKEITPLIAGQDFLSSILMIASNQIENGDQEISFTVPVESFEHYEDWLGSVASKAGYPRLRIIDEPSAAALGYSAHIQSGSVYLVFDFGGGTMHAAVVIMEDTDNQPTGRRCRVLGKAGRFIGGATIDQWIYSEVLKRTNHQDYEDTVRTISNSLLTTCETAKEYLSTHESAPVLVKIPQTQEEIGVTLTRNNFEELLDQNGLFTEINRTIRDALNQAREYGFEEDTIHAALMVGGSCAIPSVQRAVRQVFGAERVFNSRPLDAVVRGAAAFIAGVDFFDYIQHDYAIRYTNSSSGEYEYRPIVKHGTPYPSQTPVTTLIIKSAFSGQTKLGIAIFEISKENKIPQNNLELIFDPSGAARLIQITPQETEKRQYYWLNESQPTFLEANPPGKQGEPRFEIEFNIDKNKRLTITARDLFTNRLTIEEFPVVKLT